LHDLEDQAFDLVVSIFGAMFASKRFDVAREMVRVTRPGGRIVMGNWIPGHPTLVAQILKISSSYTPPPPEGFVSPMTWGTESNVIERFSKARIPAGDIRFARDTFTFNYPSAPSALLQEFRAYYGPTMSAFEAAEKNGRAGDLQKELEELFNRENKSPDKNAIPFRPHSCARRLRFENARRRRTSAWSLCLLLTAPTKIDSGRSATSSNVWRRSVAKRS
jgi:hypothetical protein